MKTSQLKIAGIVLVSHHLSGLDATAQQKPNILWVTIEDTSPQFIGCYGNKDARMPVIDKLAGEGVRFTNAFSTGTVCSPSRTCIITGVKTYKTGARNHRSNYPIPEFIKGFPYYLQKEGYYTSNNSKTDYNVANAAKFIKIVEKMGNLLKSEITRSRDVLLLPEYELGLISASTTPYEFRLDDKKYPVAEIYNGIHAVNTKLLKS